MTVKWPKTETTWQRFASSLNDLFFRNTSTLSTDQLNLYLGQTEVVPYYKLLPEQLDSTKADSASIRQSRLQPLD